MNEFSRISVIGSGNVAWHIAPALENCGIAVGEVYSRNPANADKLVKRLYNARRKDNLDFTDSSSELFLICVSDNAIEDISREIVLPDHAALVHTSGSVSIDVLSFSAALNLGVFYPLQTFSKDLKISFKSIPILVEATDSSTEGKLLKIGKELSKKVVVAKSEDRKIIHLAAVFASNFTNHMLTRAKGIVEERNFDFELLKPLIAETLNKSLNIGPESAQTGPARREDFNILEEHMQLLEDEDLRQIYKLISQDIINQYQ